LIVGARHAQVHAAVLPALRAAAEEALELMGSAAGFPDERLGLLFVCAHPAIAASARTPLMLQTVLGLDAARIASAFLLKPATMGQRLSRAKAKIRDARIAFERPEATELPSRLDAVLDAIYAAYGSGWEDIAGADPRRRGLAAEALELGRLLVRLMPAEPEALGLLALMLYCESRREARRGPSGEYIPLSEQETARWSGPMMIEAERMLHAAAGMKRTGRFQLEAAIQSAHAERARTGRTDWDAVALLYEGLVRTTPTVGGLVGRAAANAEARGPDAGWLLLQEIRGEAALNYQPYWALAAHLLRLLGREDEAAAAYGRAIGLCQDQAMREFLSRQLARGDSRVR
ncbi:MAG TPA: DUF6596 domain-containing protein, partial [Candidatus Kapabacteria bacterium]|nr:DUF6596 domain-containing protein [Candidatus Kapabacteria bacterium]